MSAEVLQKLPAGEPIYAVLDGARDRRIRGFVFDTRAPKWCLYRGKLTRDLEDAAPWLVQLAPEAPSTERFFSQFWGRSCGVLLSTKLPGPDLRRHLRRFLMARTEQGKVLLFRYYDPRVLRVYLPSLTPGESKQFFGGISAYLVEGEDGDSPLLFRPAAA